MFDPILAKSAASLEYVDLGYPHRFDPLTRDADGIIVLIGDLDGGGRASTAAPVTGRPATGREAGSGRRPYEHRVANDATPFIKSNDPLPLALNWVRTNGGSILA